VTRQRLRLMLESAERASEMPNLDRERIQRAIRLSDMTAGEAMIPLAQVVGAPASHSVADLCAIRRETGYRRIPLYEGNISNIVSIAAWTVWDESAPDFEQRSIEALTAPPHFASIIQRLDELLPVLLTRADRMVVAVDEFGTATGIVTLEDLMTILLGDVARGAHLGPQGEAGEIPIEHDGDNVFVFDARARLAEVGELLDVELPAREFHTVGGLLTSRLRHIPAVGDSLVESGQRFTVLEATSRAATRVRVEPAS
jgi:CBS domain containing-hemolysin-like protein